jgi:glucokinase
MTIKLVADIGGTNIRLAIVEPSNKLANIEVFQCADFPSLESVIRSYLEQYHYNPADVSACLGIACPVEQDHIVMTNLPWQFSKSALKKQLGLENLWLINDYTAVAHAIPLLSDTQKVKIGGGEVVAHKPIAVCGPGTGLGVANLIYHEDQWICISGEGGHVDFAPIDETEILILKYLLKKYRHVSYEQLLSGLGIEQIYQALCQINQQTAQAFAAKDITAKALAKECALCEETLERFCQILGSFAGNLALTVASFGGVYIAGGIVPRFIEFFKQSGFRQRFEEKGRLSALNQHIATYVITESQPGLVGAAAYLSQKV